MSKEVTLKMLYDEFLQNKPHANAVMVLTAASESDTERVVVSNVSFETSSGLVRIDEGDGGLPEINGVVTAGTMYVVNNMLTPEYYHEYDKEWVYAPYSEHTLMREAYAVAPGRCNAQILDKSIFGGIVHYPNQKVLHWMVGGCPFTLHWESQPKKYRVASNDNAVDIVSARTPLEAQEKFYILAAKRKGGVWKSRITTRDEIAAEGA